MRRDWLEETVVQKTIDVVLQPDIIQHISEKCYEMQLRYLEDNSDIIFFENRLAEVEKAIKNTLKAIETGVSTKTLPARLAELENEQESIEAELAIAKATDVVITPEQITYLLLQFAQPQDDETIDEYRSRVIKCFIHKVFLFDDKLLIYYNINRDGESKERSNVELLEEVLAEEFDQGKAGSTKEALEQHGSRASSYISVPSTAPTIRKETQPCK